MQIGISQPLGFVTLSVIQALASTTVAFFYDWRVTIVVLATFPILAVALAFIGRGLQPAIQEHEAKLLESANIVELAISNIATLKCFSTQTQEYGRYGTSLNKTASCYGEQARIIALQSGFMRFGSIAVVLIAMFYGTNLIHQGKSDAGKILTSFWSALAVSKAIDEVLTHFHNLEKGRAAAAALQATIQSVQKGRRSHLSVSGYMPGSLTGDIEARNVR